jgi:hypothetical protein
VAPVAVAALVALAACGGGDAADTAADPLATDSALTRDLALAGQDTAAVPPLADVPVEEPVAAPPPASRPRPQPTRPAPRPVEQAPAPAPAPAPAAPETGVVAAGTTLTFSASEKVCSDMQVGERFSAPLAGSVSGTNGAVVPSGATGTFEVTDAKRAANQNDETFLRVRLVAVSYGGNTYPVRASTREAGTTKVRASSTGNDAKKVAAGAVVGAIAGRLLGKNTKGAVVGAAAGAAAGTAAAMGTADWDTCLQPGATITVALDDAMTVRLAGE